MVGIQGRGSPQFAGPREVGRQGSGLVGGWLGSVRLAEGQVKVMVGQDKSGQGRAGMVDRVNPVLSRQSRVVMILVGWLEFTRCWLVCLLVC